jgi:hypothetical protein
MFYKSIILVVILVGFSFHTLQASLHSDSLNRRFGVYQTNSVSFKYAVYNGGMGISLKGEEFIGYLGVGGLSISNPKFCLGAQLGVEYAPNIKKKKIFGSFKEMVSGFNLVPHTSRDYILLFRHEVNINYSLKNFILSAGLGLTTFCEFLKIHEAIPGPNHTVAGYRDYYSKDIGAYLHGGLSVVYFLH